MTNLEALQGSLIYPFPINTGKLHLTNRGIDAESAYTSSSRQFNLAIADTIRSLITAPDIKEGDYAISQTSKDQLIKLASSIYKANGEEDPFAVSQPKIRNKSNVW